MQCGVSYVVHEHGLPHGHDCPVRHGTLVCGRCVTALGLGLAPRIPPRAMCFSLPGRVLSSIVTSKLTCIGPQSPRPLVHNRVHGFSKCLLLHVCLG